jgi:RNA polymerase sigma factor (sigma-70 family)
MIDIVSVGNQKVEYKDHNDIQFESLSFYLTLAQKAIAKFGSNFSSSVSKEMLKSEDAIANVANSLMMADWRWDKDRKGLSGQQKTKYSYRNQCAIWAIKSYLTRKKNKKYKNVDAYLSSLDGDKEMSLLDIAHNDNDDPLDIILKHESDSSIKQYLNMILSTDINILTERQSEYIKLYFFEDLTFAEIGKRFNITREAVRQGIKKALEKIRELDHEVRS